MAINQFLFIKKGKIGCDCLPRQLKLNSSELWILVRLSVVDISQSYGYWILIIYQWILVIVPLKWLLSCNRPVD